MPRLPISLSAQGESFPLIAPFRISRGVKTQADVITATVSTGGHVGRGEGVPYPRYGESVKASLAEIETVRPALEECASRIDLLRLMKPGAARNAVDCALWALESNQRGLPVHALAGLPAPKPVATAMTVSLDTPDAMARAAYALRAAPLIKVKVDATDPADQIAAVRDAAPAPRMIVDPNESWTVDTLRTLGDALAGWRVDLLEQPLAAGEDEGLRGLGLPVPIAADESVHTADDVEALIGRYQIINIKLDKAGGLTAALMLADAAHKAGLGLMTGCMICSSLSIVPILTIAGQAEFADLDGPFWLKQDRPGGVREEQGMITPADKGFWDAG